MMGPIFEIEFDAPSVGVRKQKYVLKNIKHNLYPEIPSRVYRHIRLNKKCLHVNFSRGRIPVEKFDE